MKKLNKANRRVLLRWRRRRTGTTALAVGGGRGGGCGAPRRREEDGWDGHEVGGLVVVTARVGVAGTGGAKGGGSMLWRGRRSSGRRLRRT